jgi:hypothetical protein
MRFSDAVHFIVSGSVEHIDDPLGLNRRLFEGWMTLGGIDFQKMEVTPEAFEDAFRVFLAKNPVVVWDHKRHLPLGRILAMTLYPDEGVFVQGEVFRFDDPVFAFWEEQELIDNDDIPNIQRNCDQVWALMQTGVIRGISWHGDTLRCQYVYSEQLGEYVEQHTQVTIKEVTVTPIQVHPGAQITAVNTLAKALELTKALPLCHSEPPDSNNSIHNHHQNHSDSGRTPLMTREERIHRLRAQQAQMASAQNDLVAQLKEMQEMGIEPDEEFLAFQKQLGEHHTQLTKALNLTGDSSKPAETTETVGADNPSSSTAQTVFSEPAVVADEEVRQQLAQLTKSLELQQEQNESLQQELSALKAEPAPLRNRISHTPGVQTLPRPVQTSSEVEPLQLLTKALELASENDERVRALEEHEVMKINLIVSGSRMNIDPKRDEVQASFSPRAQAVFRSLAQDLSAGLL